MAKGSGRTETAVQKKDFAVFCFPYDFSYYLVAQCLE